MATATTATRVRVAYCIDGMGIGGTELNALRTAERLDPSRFDVSVVCLQQEGPLFSRYRERGISVLALPLGRLHGIKAVRQGMRLARYLSAQQVDIVHSHDAYNNIFATVWARMARTPVVIASRRWCDDLPRRALAVVNRFGFRLADCIIANSTQVASLVVTEDRVPATRVAVVPNFVDESAFTAPNPAHRAQLRTELGLDPRCIVIGCIAGLRPVKDHETLIRAVADLRSRWPLLRLVLVGDGELRLRLEALVRQLGLTDTVVFAGARPNEPNLHHLFDISVLSSLSEGLPNTIVEAMAAGKPVVATRVGGVVDAVLDGETGTLVPARSPTDFATAIEQLLLHTTLRQSMGDAARRRARSEFHVTNVLGRLESLYERLLTSRAR
ncbi:MAG TPA: glycosyltransferase [Gemmatimonadaceae bacterium]|nr:glycosyltransferase [Gemmatimonadaceae bacterium]